MIVTVVFPLVIVMLFGLALGSFGTAVSWRAARGESWIVMEGKGKAARSRCPECGTLLGLRDMVPVFSWLFQRGKCRYCKATIPARYPLIELATMLACLGVYASWGLNVSAVALMVSVGFMVAGAAADLEARKPAVQVALLASVFAGIALGWHGITRDFTGIAPLALGLALAGGSVVLAYKKEWKPPTFPAAFWGFFLCYILLILFGLLTSPR